MKTKQITYGLCGALLFTGLTGIGLYFGLRSKPVPQASIISYNKYEWHLRKGDGLKTIDCFLSSDGGYVGHVVIQDAEENSWNAYFIKVEHWSYGDEFKEEFATFKDEASAKRYVEVKANEAGK